MYMYTHMYMYRHKMVSFQRSEHSLLHFSGREDQESWLQDATKWK